MKAYLNLIDERKLKEDIKEILKLEKLVDGKSQVEVSLELVKEELDYLLKLDRVSKLQKELRKYKKKRKKLKSEDDKKWNKIEIKSTLNRLNKIRNQYKYLDKYLEAYRNFLKLVMASKLDKTILYKFLDKDEFHHLLNTDPYILMLVWEWRHTSNVKSIDREKFYFENLAKLRNVMHELDMLNN